MRALAAITWGVRGLGMPALSYRFFEKAIEYRLPPPPPPASLAA
jgi:hypothetical protein